MSIDFKRLKGIETVRGLVTKIEDLLGRVIWQAQSGEDVVLEVKKITVNTYAGGIKYTNEKFVAIDVYPKTNGTASVTYGGVTKTVTDTSGVEKPNAQTVYFGTLYGVSDEVETPESGVLTITGDFNEFGVGVYSEPITMGSYVFPMSAYCGCITGVKSWGQVKSVPINGFRSCTDLIVDIIPKQIKSFGNYAFSDSSITNFTAWETVSNLGSNMFYNAKSLKTAVITGDSSIVKIPNYMFYNCNALEKCVINSNSITEIGDYAFQNCTALTSVGLSNITEIKRYAFYGCTSLKEINLPQGLTTIGSEAFQNCYSLENITLPNTVTLINSSLFSGCNKLNHVVVPPSVTEIRYNSLACYKDEYGRLAGDYYMRSKTPPIMSTTPVNNILCGAFGAPAETENITIWVPEGCGQAYKTAENWSLYAGSIKEEIIEPAVLEVAKITSDTYAGETTYTGEEFILLDIYPQPYATVSVTYGGLTKTITDTSGAESPNAQRVYFGTFNGVTDDVATPASGTLTINGHIQGFAIGTYKKENSSAKTETKYCSCITGVTDWGAATRIPGYAFYACDKLTSVSIPESVTSIGGYAFYNCEELTSVSIPESVTSIGGYAFYNCKKITSVSIPAGVTEIGDRTFMYCNELVELTLREGITKIGDYAFFACNKLNNVVIPASVTHLGICSLICYEDEYGIPAGKYHMLGTTPPEVKTDDVGDSLYTPFNTGIVNAAQFRIFVPNGCAEVYKNDWGILTNYIEEEK